MGPQTHNICAAAKEKFLKGALLCAECCLAIFLRVFWSILSLWLRAKRSLIFCNDSFSSFQQVNKEWNWTYIYSYIGGSVSKESTCNAGDGVQSLDRRIQGKDFPGEGNGNPLPYSCLGNSMDRGAWWVTVHGVARVRYDLVTKATTTTTIQEKKKERERERNN